MRKPRPLARGAVVRLVAPAGPVPPEPFAAGVQVLAGFGLVPRWEPDLLRNEGYLAGADARRADEFVEAFASDEADGVLAARGGYGAMRILDAVAARADALRPKFFQGFSDITALHLLFQAAGDLVTFHGPNVTTLGAVDPESRRRTRNALLGLDREATFAWDGLAPVTGGRARGRLVCGNLTVLDAMMGTRYAPDLRGAILLVEDLNETTYRLDRLLMQVALAAGSAGIAGVVVGDLRLPADEVGSEGKIKQLDEAVRHFAEALDRPVVTGFPAGHGRHLHPVPLGVAAELDADRGTLRVVEDPYG